MNASKLFPVSLAILCILFATGCPRPPLRMVYDQGSCTSIGWYSELNPVADNTWGQQTGDDFILTEGSSSVTQVRWWGAYRDDFPVEDDFTFRIYETSDGLVPNPVYSSQHHAGAVNRTMTSHSVTCGGDDLNVYAYTCNIPATEFEPDERYYLVILNDTGKWMWTLCESSEAANDLCLRRSTTSGSWGLYGTDAAFQLWTNQR